MGVPHDNPGHGTHRLSGVRHVRIRRHGSALCGTGQHPCRGMMKMKASWGYLMGPMAEFYSRQYHCRHRGQSQGEVKRQGTADVPGGTGAQGRFLKLCRHVQRQRGLCGICRGAGYPVIMGSKSTNLKSRVGGYEGRKLGAGR